MRPAAGGVVRVASVMVKSWVWPALAPAQLDTTTSAAPVVANCDDGGNPRVLADDNGYKIHPSVVSFHPNGSVVVGAEAKQRKVIDPRNTVYSVKRLIGRSFRSREIQAAQQRMPYVIKE